MERNYVIPLRKEFQKAPIYKRAQKAAYATKAFLQKHMKTENVKLGRHLNMYIWKNGPRNPPGKVEVHVELVKDADGDYAYAELVGKEKEVLKPIKIEKAKGLAGKIESVVGGSGKEEKKDPKKEAEKKVKAEVLKKGEDKKAKVIEEKVAKEEKKEVQEMKREEKIVTRDKKE